MKYLLDTNVYIDLLRNPAQLAVRRSVLQRILPQTWLSAVVLHELLAGARGTQGRKWVEAAVATLVRTGRVVAPTNAEWKEAGAVRGRLWERQANLRTKELQNDVLIMCTARQIGAHVVTANAGDFGTIASLVKVTHGTLDELTF